MLNVIMDTMLILWTDQHKYVVGLLQYFPNVSYYTNAVFLFLKIFFF